MKRSLIFGVSGQDGSYLAELLLNYGYDVHGLIRRKSDPRLDNIVHIVDRIVLHSGDICDQASVDHVVGDVQPDELYALAAQSFVQASFGQPIYTAMATGLGILHVLEAVRRTSPKTRVYVAGSSEQFGQSPPPQHELTITDPQSPYGVAKVFARDMAKVYRRAYGLSVSVGILFNHESPIRGLEFVTRKISMGVAKIAHGHATHIELGNLDSRRDWGYAKDYVRAMHMMLQTEQPDDFAIGTGVDHSVKDFVMAALKAAGLEPDVDRYVRTSTAHVRPAEVHVLRADASKAKRVLGWVPLVTFNELVEMMVTADLARVDGTFDLQLHR